MWTIDIELHKKGSSSHTTVQSYQPTEQEIRLQEQAANYSEAVAPNALWLNNIAKNLLQDSLGTIQVDYNKLLGNAQQQIGNAQQGVADLTQGKLPTAYQENMENSIKSGVENTMGNLLNSMGSRGILNSSVTNTAMNDISKNVSDTMAQQYQNNIGTLNGLYGQQAGLAGQQITTAAGAQEAAQSPALNLWNASLGLNSGGTLGALSVMGNQGTTTTTQKTSGGGGLFGGLVGSLGSGYMSALGGGLFCFTEDTKVKTADGDKLIRHIKLGDKVLAYDKNEDKVTLETVEGVMQPHYSEVYAVICEGDKGEKRYVNTTLSQPLLTDDGEFIQVAMMRIGTKLKGIGKVKSIMLSGERKVYDLKVTGANTYYVNGFIAKGATNEW